MAIGIFIGNSVGNKKSSSYWTTLNPLIWINDVTISFYDRSGNGNNLTSGTIFDAGDSFTFPNTTAVKNAITKSGAYDVFYDWTGNPRRVKISQLAYSYGSNFFHNGRTLLLFADDMTTDIPKIMQGLWHNTPDRIFSIDSTGTMKDNASNAVTLRTSPYIQTGENIVFAAHASYNLSLFTAAITIQGSKLPTADYAVLFGNSKSGLGWEIRLRSDGEINCVTSHTSGSPAYTNVVTKMPYLDGDEHTIMLVQDGQNLTLETEFEKIVVANPVNPVTLNYAAGSQVCIGNRNAGTQSFNNLFVSYARIYNAVKTYQEVCNLDPTGLVFNAENCYHESIQNVNGTISVAKTIAQMTYEISSDPYFAGYYYVPHYNFNPSGNSDALSLLLDKGSYVGNTGGKPEIWTRSGHTGISPTFWRSAYLCQEAILADVVSAYQGKIFIKQTKYPKDNKSLRFFYELFIQLFSVANTSSHLYSFVGTSATAHIIKNVTSVADYSGTLNAALAAYSNVIIHNSKLLADDSILVQSNQTLTFSSSCLKLGSNINKNLIRNVDFVNGNENITLKSKGKSIIYGNSAAQNRSLYPSTLPGTGFYNYYASFFVKVNNLNYDDLKIVESAAWSCPFQKCTDADVSNIEIYGTGKYVTNQDGMGGFHFGSSRCIARFSICKVADDNFAVLNYDMSTATGFGWGYVDEDLTNVSEKIHCYGFRWDSGLVARNGNLIRMYSYGNASVNFFPINNIEAYDFINNCVTLDLGTTAVRFSGNATGRGSGFKFWNIFGGIYGTSAVKYQNYFSAGTWDDIEITQTVDNTTANYTYLIKIDAGVTLDSVLINSHLDKQPATVVYSNAGTVTNLVHNET